MVRRSRAALPQPTPSTPLSSAPGPGDFTSSVSWDVGVRAEVAMATVMVGTAIATAGIVQMGKSWREDITCPERLS